MGRRIGASILGAIFGLLCGVGFGVFLIEARVLSATSLWGLAVPIAGLLVGMWAGAKGGRKRTTPAS